MTGARQSLIIFFADSSFNLGGVTVAVQPGSCEGCCWSLAATLISTVLLLAVEDRDRLILEFVGQADCADKEKHHSLRCGRGHQTQLLPAPTRQAHT